MSWTGPLLIAALVAVIFVAAAVMVKRLSAEPEHRPDPFPFSHLTYEPEPDPDVEQFLADAVESWLHDQEDA